ncbi:hypothetical protein AVEN_63272-1 [Araneus ventricosus]|uniref:Uncharacterized protein n=1 Tax=Araneus ventricosus TaxID=182803 RepID=A0A4Y2K1M0_ARAVE|nr:hypothetical protein AVEN_63272-1 [Araneus ventricosus]
MSTDSTKEDFSKRLVFVLCYKELGISMENVKNNLSVSMCKYRQLRICRDINFPSLVSWENDEQLIERLRQHCLRFLPVDRTDKNCVPATEFDRHDWSDCLTLPTSGCQRPLLSTVSTTVKIYPQ